MTKEQAGIQKVLKSCFLSIKAIDPDTGDNEKKAAWGLLYQKAYEIWRGKNLFLPETLLEDGGVLDGAGTALFYIPTVPRTEDYDPEDYNWTKIPKFEYKEVKIDVDTFFKVQRKIDDGDALRMKNRFASGNYEGVANFVLVIA